MSNYKKIKIHLFYFQFFLSLLILSSCALKTKGELPVDGGNICDGGSVLCGHFCVDTQSDRNNCGVCGKKCEDPYAVCIGGECKCSAPFVECSGKCVNTQIDRNNCGGCGKKCDNMAQCVSGKCQCGQGFTDCNGKCVNTNTDSQNCGECGHACTGNEVCNGQGVCTVECSSGYTLCEGNPSYCADINSDPMNCGECGHICGPYDHAFPVCSSGNCDMLCDFGYGDANNWMNDGCECTITAGGNEVCDGTDNDCNGRADETFSCVFGNEEECTAYGTCIGNHRCEQPNCAYGNCWSPSWNCEPPGSTDRQYCGDGGCGVQSRTCNSDCSWGEWGECRLRSGNECFTGETRHCGNCGTETCVSCNWSGNCENQGVCHPGDTQTQSCGNCGTQTRTCNSSCQWGSWGSCTGEGVCQPGATENCTTTCGTTGSKTCSSSCTWGNCNPPPETCNGIDDDCDGQCDEPGCCMGTTENCTTTCGTTGSKTCSSSCTWGNCNPPPETCNGIDDDCDGQCDEPGCCMGTTESENCGNCGTHTRTCNSSCQWGDWGNCLGDKKANGESCSSNDECCSRNCCPPGGPNRSCTESPCGT